MRRDDGGIIRQAACLPACRSTHLYLLYVFGGGGTCIVRLVVILWQFRHPISSNVSLHRNDGLDTPPDRIMGKLNRIEEKDNNVTVHYTKLQDEDSGSCHSGDGFQVMPALSEYLSYTCKHCGHTQALQGRALTIFDEKRRLYSVNDVYTNNIQDSTVADGDAMDRRLGNQVNSFKKIMEKPSLIKQIGKGLNVTDEEVCSLVSEGSSASCPSTQANISTFSCEESTKASGMNFPPPNIFNKLESFTGDDLKLAPWYQEGIPREIALEILSQEPIGSFMVRRSTTKMGCYALSVRVPRSFQLSGIAHYLIMRTKRGYRIKGFTKEFTTLVALITHHSVMPELLPCPLQLSRYHPIFVISDSRRDFADVKCNVEVTLEKDGAGQKQLS
ncbi:uncharacterized protein LOC143200210 [Rhynchophorus ferrugineus]|uniref:uncharacterized protein LOC143200210 n=1 Tax=Rhynchophorus ferrugineus TaxID=354439 RepID=UPI003FCEA86C